MTKARDLLVYPYQEKYVVIGGNMHLQAYKKLKWKEVPCCILPEDTPIEKLRQMLIQDNNPFGENDWDLLANEWDSEELNYWEFEVWQEDKDRNKPAPNQKTEERESQQDNADFYAMMLGDRIIAIVFLSIVQVCRVHPHQAER